MAHRGRPGPGAPRAPDTEREALGEAPAGTLRSSIAVPACRPRSTGRPAGSRSSNELEREFLAESRAESERELAHQRRANRRLRALLAGVGVLLVLAVIAGALALRRTWQREGRGDGGDGSAPQCRGAARGRHRSLPPPGAPGRRASTSRPRRCRDSRPRSCVRPRRSGSSVHSPAGCSDRSESPMTGS